MNVRRRPVLASFLAFALAAGAFAAWLWSGMGWHPAVAWLVAANVAVLPLWAWDKHRARRGGFRVPESALHLAALAGAVPGSLLAMALFRHKTLKTRFRVLYGLFLALQVGLGVAVLS